MEGGRGGREREGGKEGGREGRREGGEGEGYNAEDIPLSMWSSAADMELSLLDHPQLS